MKTYKVRSSMSANSSVSFSKVGRCIQFIWIRRVGAWISLLLALGMHSIGISSVKAGINASTLSFPFLANAGQLSEVVAYYAPTPGGTLYVTRDGVLVYTLSRSPNDTTGSESIADELFLTETPLGGQSRVKSGLSAPTRVNVLRGSDPKHWQHNVETYQTVSLGKVWPGIAVELFARAGSVEKRLLLEPGSKAESIRFRLKGAQALRITAEGDLEARISGGALRFTAPVAWQINDDKRHAVEVAYLLQGDTYGFYLGEHDRTLPVIIDPIIQTTYLGGSGIEYGWDIAVHPTNGTVYIAGETRSDDFPDTLSGAQSDSSGGRDAFVGRLNSQLSVLEQATYLGGALDDVAMAITLDSTNGTVFVTGYTRSADFPGTTGGAQSALSGDIDAFVARLNAELTILEQATYIGGSVPPPFVGFKANDIGSDLTIHPNNGDLYVAGRTSSQDFPGTGGGAQSAPAAYDDAFVARFTPDLTSLTRSTYLGGSGNDDAHAILVHPTTGEIYTAGFTSFNPFTLDITENDFPGTSGGGQEIFGGMRDGFLARLSTDLTTLEQTTYIGGSNMESVNSIDLGALGTFIYAAGYTGSADLPETAGGAQTTISGSSDAFLAQFNSDLTVLHQSTYLGGYSSERAHDLELSPLSDEIFVMGKTFSKDFPGATCGLQWRSRSQDAFVARLSADLTALNQSTYLGGASLDIGYGMALDPVTGNVYLTGESESDDFPGIAGGAQEMSGGSTDAFAALLSANLLLPVVTDPSLDIDANGRRDALSDGVLIIRYLFGFRGESLTNGAVDPGCTRCTDIEIEDYLELERCSEVFDVDGNGEQDTLSDGVLITRYLFGFRGNTLIDGAVAPDCTRCTAAAIEAYIADLLEGD